MDNLIFPNLPCSQGSCRQRARWVVVQTNDMNLLFGSMAGVVCTDHAKQLEKIGGAACSFEEYGKAAQVRRP